MNQDQDQDHPHRQPHNHGHNLPAQRPQTLNCQTVNRNLMQKDSVLQLFTASLTWQKGSAPVFTATAHAVPLCSNPIKGEHRQGGVITSRLTGSSGCLRPFFPHRNRAHMVTGYRTWFFWRQTLESDSRLRDWCFGCWGLSFGGGESSKLGEVFLYCYVAKLFEQQQGTVERNKQQQTVGKSFSSDTWYQMSQASLEVPRRAPIRKTVPGPYIP